MPATCTRQPHRSSILRRGMLFVTGVAAACLIAGCTVDEVISQSSTGGSGGTHSVAGAGGGAGNNTLVSPTSPSDGGVSADAGTR